MGKAITEIDSYAGPMSGTTKLPVSDSDTLQAGTASQVLTYIVANLGNAATKNVGTTTGTVAAGDDARLSDARTPTSHTHALADLTQSGATTGQVPQWSGSEWVAATPSGGGSPGGATTQLQFNNSGAFGGDANMTWDSTLKRLTLVSTYTSPVQVVAPSFEIKNAAGVSKIGAGVYNTGWVVNADYFLATTNGQFGGMIAGGNNIGSSSGWWNLSTAGLAFPYAAGYVGFGASNSVDVAFCRNAAGVMELDSGTAGTFRDLKLRNLIGTGNLATGAVAKTADYTATTSDGTIEVDASGAARTITLFAASSNAGKILVIKKTDSSANAVTIDGNASETIDGAATISLASQYSTAILQVNAAGTGWNKLAGV